MKEFFEKFKIYLDIKKIGLIAVAVILFFLVMDLNSRLNELSRLTSQRDQAATVVAELESTLGVLKTQVEYARSEGAVEEWAYGEGKMVRPGENLIIPLSPPGTTPQPVLLPTQVVEPVQNWEIWMALILGK
jgi:cell division protein FtsB